MSTTRTSRTWAILFGGIAVVGIGLALGYQHPGAAGQQPAGHEPAAILTSVAAEQVPKADDRQPDQAAIRSAIEGFTAAFRKNDAKVLAASWAADGEYVSGDGTTIRGRPALEKAYADFFAKNPGNMLEVEVQSVRFPSRDTAVVEGHFKLRKAKGELVVSKCSFLLAREDGKWLIAIAREWPGDGHTLRDLEWLIGTWEATRDGTTVNTTYEWTANKAFIRCRFTVTKDGAAHTGIQMIGKDPTSGALREWTFEDDGGLGEAEFIRDGKKWLLVTRGATADGRELTATNILTPVDADAFLWQSVERALDGEPLLDLPPMKVVRVKGGK